MSRIRVYLAMSLDGFIAGENDDLSWLPQPGSEIESVQEEAGVAPIEFGPFMESIGCMLMGRRTFDVVTGFGGPWPYGETPVLVATHRALTAPEGAVVDTASGDIEAMLNRAQRLAGERDVYLDGGALVRQALLADRVDDLILTVVPTILGAGLALFDGVTARSAWRFLPPARYGSMVQLHATSA